jgi:hypothetical protein
MNRLRPRAPLLIDLADVPEGHCDDCLEGLFKALAVAPPGTDDRTIWRPHENEWLTAHVEDVTRWGQRALQAIQDAIAGALTGAPVGELRKAAPWERMDTAERERTRARLEALTPNAWTIEDWMAYADLIMADYLPDGVIRDMAEFAIVRGQLSGKIAASLEAQARPVLPGAAAAIVGNLPTSRRFGMPPKMLTPVEQAILDTSVERAAITIAGLADDTRKAVKMTLVEGIRATVLGERDGGDEALRSRLLDSFGTLNRDWRRIAVTETGEAHTMGYVAAQAVGTKLRRQEAYVGACDFCRAINGRVMRVVAPDDPARDGETDVWVGKTNAGRSASPKRREGDVLVERSPDQRWWVAAGLMHPHCRGRWVMEAPAPMEQADDDGDFQAWLDAEAKRHGLP